MQTGSPNMSSLRYFRSQAELCARLALVSSDEQEAKRFALLSLQFLAKAVELEQAPQSDSRAGTNARGRDGNGAGASLLDRPSAFEKMQMNSEPGAAS